MVENLERLEHILDNPLDYPLNQKTYYSPYKQGRCLASWYDFTFGENYEDDRSWEFTQLDCDLHFSEAFLLFAASTSLIIQRATLNALKQGRRYWKGGCIIFNSENEIASSNPEKLRTFFNDENIKVEKNW